MTNREAILAILEREGYPLPDGRTKVYADRAQKYPHDTDFAALRFGALCQLSSRQLAYKWHHPQAHVDCGTRISDEGVLLGQFQPHNPAKPAVIPEPPRPTPDRAPTKAVSPLGPKARRFAALPEAKREAIGTMFKLAYDAAVAQPAPALELSPQDKAARGAVRLAILRLRAPCRVNAHELMNLARVYWQVSLSPHRSEAQSKALQAKTRAVYRALEKRADCPEWLLA